MKENPSHGGGPVRNPPGESFALFLVVGLGGNAVGMAISLGMAGLVLGLPVRSLPVPYVALLVPGLVIGPLLYWARLPSGWPKSRPLRAGICMFFYGQALTLALGFSAVWLHILSFHEAAEIFGPLACLLPAVAFPAAYAVVRRDVAGEPSRAGSSTQRLGSAKLPVFLATVFGVHAAAAAVCVGISGLLLDIPPRKLLVPYLVFAYCGIVLGVLLHCVRMARERWSTWYPLISGTAMLSYATVLLLALGFSAMTLHFLSFQQAVNEFAGTADLFVAVAFIAGYAYARRIAKASNRGDAA